MTDADLHRALLESYSGIVYIYDLREEKNIFLNKRWAEDFGYTIEETQSQPNLLASLIHPEDLTGAIEHHQALQRLPDNTTRALEYRIRHKQGHYLWLRSIDRPFRRNEEGRVVQIAGYAEEITQQRKLKLEREKAESRFKTEATLRAGIIENAVEGICVCEEIPEEPGIRFSVWNRMMTEISGYTIEEINKLGWYQTVYKDPETQARAADRMERMRRGEPLDAEEWVITRKDGEQRTLLISTNVIVLENDTPKVLGVMHDVTSKVELETRLRDAARMEAIGRLAGSVAHDFNNTLAVILGAASLIQDEVDMDELHQQMLVDLISSAERGAELTRNLLTFSRRQRADKKVFNLSQLVQQTLRIVTRLIDANIRIASDIAPDCYVEGDAGMLDQAMMNLMLNARDSMPQGGTLSVRLQAGDPLSLIVSDTGGGIDESLRAQIFEPFFTTKGEGKGTGLGLATVYGCVTQHSGNIEVESSPDSGTSFRVTLPSCEKPQQKDSRIPTSQPVPQLSVLLVEDQAPVRRVVRAMLEAHGHQVVEATGGDEAIKTFRKSDGFDLLLTDVALGEGPSGPDVAGTIGPQAPRMQIVFMSGFSNCLGTLDLEEGQNFLQKPFSAESLYELLSNRFG